MSFEEPVCLTFDVDWAPDFMIDATADLLIASGVRSTWLVTHRSDAVDRLRARPDLFELGIHPNFREGSTHGSTAGEVLRHCMELVPEAVSMRTHGLVQSTSLLTQIAATTPIRIDASLLLPRATHLQPLLHIFGGRPLLRVPFQWEDDVEMEFPDARWDVGHALQQPGLRAFNFHPVHVFLNSRSMAPYRRLCDAGGPLHAVSESVARAQIQEGEGTKTALQQLLELVPRDRTRMLRDFL